MFTHIAIHYPRPEYRDQLIASMKRVAAAAEGLDGLVRIGPWREASGDRLVGLSMWESKAAFDAAGPAIFAAVAADPFDLWESQPPESFYLDEL
jgi:hypothetical protein